mgnify:CR=1 FL=1
MDLSILPEHYAHVGSGPQRQTWAFCRCGWRGRQYDGDIHAALRDRDEHVAGQQAAGQGGGDGE